MLPRVDYHCLKMGCNSYIAATPIGHPISIRLYCDLEFIEGVIDILVGHMCDEIFGLGIGTCLS